MGVVVPLRGVQPCSQHASSEDPQLQAPEIQNHYAVMPSDGGDRQQVKKAVSRDEPGLC